LNKNKNKNENIRKRHDVMRSMPWAQIQVRAIWPIWEKKKKCRGLFEVIISRFVIDEALVAITEGSIQWRGI
jgi:hypothetical protein